MQPFGPTCFYLNVSNKLLNNGRKIGKISILEIPIFSKLSEIFNKNIAMNSSLEQKNIDHQNYYPQLYLVTRNVKPIQIHVQHTVYWYMYNIQYTDTCITYSIQIHVQHTVHRYNLLYWMSYYAVKANTVGFCW